MIQTMNREMHSLTATTGIRIIYELLLKRTVQFPDNKVMNNTIPEICREYFSFDWLVYYKSYRSSRMICSGVHFIVQLNQITFVIEFKRQCIDGIALLFPAILISSKEIR